MTETERELLIAATIIAILCALLSQMARAGTLPDSPGTVRGQIVETYSQDQRMVVHNRPSAVQTAKQSRIFDWSFVLGQAVYAGSLAFDSYETAKNVGTCASEGNPDLGSDPGNRRLVVHGVIEFSAVLAGSALIKWAGQRNNVPRWLNSSLGLLAPTIATAKHVKGGMDWVRLCN
jgi:hypothetical protein